MSSPRAGAGTMGSYEIVRYTPAFRHEVLELQTHLWGPERAVNAAYLDWKYGRNPYLAAPLIHLALCGGEVVGMRGMYGARWEVGRPAQTFVGPCAGDLVIAPEHRNGGLVARIMQAAANALAGSGYPYAFNLSGGLATQLGSLTTGWRSVGPVETAFWQAERPAPRDHPPGADHSPAEGRSPFDALDRNGGRGRGAGGPVSLEQAPRPEQMAELVARLGGDGRLRQVRDAEYFAWRFENPRSRYRFVFRSGARLDGYLVLQAPAYRARRPVTIVDWEAEDGRARAELLRAALRWGEFERVTIWSAGLSAEAKAILRRTGFGVAAVGGSLGRAHRERVSRPMILVRAAHPDRSECDWAIAGRRLLDPADWDLRGIYSDTF